MYLLHAYAWKLVLGGSGGGDGGGRFIFKCMQMWSRDRAKKGDEHENECRINKNFVCAFILFFWGIVVESPHPCCSFHWSLNNQRFFVFFLKKNENCSQEPVKAAPTNFKSDFWFSLRSFFRTATKLIRTAPFKKAFDMHSYSHHRCERTFFTLSLVGFGAKEQQNSPWRIHTHTSDLIDEKKSFHIQTYT